MNAGSGGPSLIRGLSKVGAATSLTARSNRVPSKVYGNVDASGGELMLLSVADFLETLSAALTFQIRKSVLDVQTKEAGVYPKPKSIV